MAFMKGTNSTLVLFIQQVKVAALDVESWDVEPDVEIIADDVCGEDRSRPDKVINLYKVNLQCFNATSDKLVKLLSYDLALDADEQPETQFGFKLSEIGGGANQFALNEAVIDNWKWAVGGRKARQMLTIPIRSRYLKKLAA